MGDSALLLSCVRVGDVSEDEAWARRGHCRVVVTCEGGRAR